MYGQITPMVLEAEAHEISFSMEFSYSVSRHNQGTVYVFLTYVLWLENEGQSWEVLSGDLTRNDPTN